MLGVQKEGPSPRKAACSKKDESETHRNRFETGMASGVQDQATLWIILPPCLTSDPPLLLAPTMNSRVFLHLARWGEVGGRAMPRPPSVLGARWPFLGPEAHLCFSPKSLTVDSGT